MPGDLILPRTKELFQEKQVQPQELQLRWTHELQAFPPAPAPAVFDVPEVANEEIIFSTSPL